MPRIVKGPDGTMHSFPDTATDQQISGALKAIPRANAPQASKAPTWADQMGLNAGTDSPVEGFFRGAGAAAVDMAEGATAAVRNRVASAGDPTMRMLHGAGPVEEQQDVAAVPESTAGQIGAVAPAVAEMAIPVGGGAKVGKAVIDAIPRTARAAGKFKEVMSAAGQLPVNISAPGNVALRIQELAERGGSMPMAVRKFLVRVTDPNKAAMNYEEARDFASNISRLSASEFGRLTPVVAREVAEMRVALNKAVAETAKQAGKADEYASAMKEYAQAMRVKNVIHSAVEGAKKSAPYATAVGAGYWLSKKFMDLIDQ